MNGANGSGGSQHQPDMTKAMVVVTDPRSSTLAYEPTDIDSALALAERLVGSRLLPKAIATAEQALIVMMAGREMGLSVLQSFRLLHVFDGKPVMSADLIVGKVKQHPACKYFTLICGTAPCTCGHPQPGEPHATYETWRAGAPKATRMTFTIRDAQAAQLTGKDNWKKYPWIMCQRRCSTELARAEYQDVVGGLYEEDEMPMQHVAVSALTASNDSGAVDAQPVPPPALVDDSVRLMADILDARDDKALKTVGNKINAAKHLPLIDIERLREKYAARRKEIQSAKSSPRKSEPRPVAQQTAPDPPPSEPPVDAEIVTANDEAWPEGRQ